MKQSDAFNDKRGPTVEAFCPWWQVISHSISTFLQLLWMWDFLEEEIQSFFVFKIQPRTVSSYVSLLNYIPTILKDKGGVQNFSY